MVLYKPGTYKTSVKAMVGNLKVDLKLTVKAVKKASAMKLPVLKLPAKLKEIEAEAFAGDSLSVVDLRGTKIKKIGSKAFADCIELVKIYIPATVTEIHANAFSGCGSVTFCCPQGSYAERYAKEHGIPVNYK